MVLDFVELVPRSDNSEMSTVERLRAYVSAGLQQAFRTDLRIHLLAASFGLALIFIFDVKGYIALVLAYLFLGLLRLLLWGMEKR